MPRITPRTDGSYIDLERVGAVCREHGTALVVDITQSAGVIPFRVDKVQPDFAMASVHKWLMGPYGFSLCYVSKKYHTGEYHGGLDHHERNRRGSDEPSWDGEGAMRVTERPGGGDEDGAVGTAGVSEAEGGFPVEYNAGARRFDAGKFHGIPAYTRARAHTHTHTHTHTRPPP